MKRIIILFILIFSSSFAYAKEKPKIYFSKMPFSEQQEFKPESIFKTGQQIYFAGYNPNGFKTRVLKLQVFKKEGEKSEFYGYEYLYNRTIELRDKKFFSDYIVINNAGFYIFQIFDYTDFKKPVILGIIKVE